MKERGINGKAQVALFVIFGILVFVGIVTLFLILPAPEFFRTGVSQDPMQEIRPCIADSLIQVLPEFQEHGFYFNLNPPRTLIYQDQEVPYHCYTDQKRTICTRNDAQAKSRIENALKNRIENQVDSCFTKFRDDNRGSNIELGLMDFSVEVLPGEIYLRTRREVSISRGEESEEPERYTNFDVTINSPVWDFMVISNEILNQEVDCNCPRESCTADISNLMRENLNYIIRFDMYVPHEKVYFIEDVVTQETLKFAVKNCDRTP